MSEQSNLKRHQHCPMRTHVGNCLIIGGFCTSIREDICDALHKSFQMGARSRAVDKASNDAISREYLEKEYWQTLIPKETVNTDVELGINIGIEKMHNVIKDAPNVLPKRSCYRCGLREDCADSTVRTAERT